MDERIVKLLSGGQKEQDEGFRLIYQHYYPAFQRSLDAAESVLRQVFHEAVVEFYLYIKSGPPPITNLKDMLLRRARWCYFRRYRLDRLLVEFQMKHEVLQQEVEIDESLVRTILREAGETCKTIFEMIFREEWAAWRVAEHFKLKNEKVAKDKIDRCIQDARSRMKTKD